MEHHPGARMEKAKYRLSDPGLAPRRTKLEIPAWAGKREPRKRFTRTDLALRSLLGRRTIRDRTILPPTAMNSASALKTTSCCWRGIGAPRPTRACNGLHSGISVPIFTPIRFYSTSGSKRAWRSGTNRTRGSIPIGRIPCRLRSQR